MIRKARPEDYEAVRGLEEMDFQLHQKARPDYFKAPEGSYTREEYQTTLDLPCPIAWLAELDGQIVGLCFGKIGETPESQSCKSRRVAFVEDLVTLPEHRGQGIGTALLERARAQAREAGAVSLELCVWAFNAEAARVYERLGMCVQYYRMEQRL